VLMAGPMRLGWLPFTTLGYMVGDYISTSFGSDGLAHGIFATASAPTTGSGTSCSTSGLDNCNEPMDTFGSGLAAGSLSSAGDAVVFSGLGGASANNLWNVVDNQGIRHRD